VPFGSLACIFWPTRIASSQVFLADLGEPAFSDAPAGNDALERHHDDVPVIRRGGDIAFGEEFPVIGRYLAQLRSKIGDFVGLLLNLHQPEAVIEQNVGRGVRVQRRHAAAEPLVGGHGDRPERHFRMIFGINLRHLLDHPESVIALVVPDDQLLRARGQPSQQAGKDNDRPQARSSCREHMVGPPQNSLTRRCWRVVLTRCCRRTVRCQRATAAPRHGEWFSPAIRDIMVANNPRRK
jgi:hypothetical protein